MAYSVKPRDETAQAALRRIARSQIGRAIAEIDASGLSRNEVVHRVRRRTKKLRALLRLVRPRFGRHVLERAAFREMAGLLAPSRDETVTGKILKKLSGALTMGVLPDDVERVRPFIGGDVHAKAAADVGAALVAVRERLRVARERTAVWTVDACGMGTFADGFELSYRRARKAMAAAEAEPVAERLHEWRKRVKDHSYHRSLLRRVLPRKLWAGRAQFDALGELLGDLNDLVMLRERICAADDALPNAARMRLLAAIDGQAHALTARSFDAGAGLFRRKPKAVARNVRRRLAAI